MPVTDMDKITPLYDAMMVHRHEYDSGDTDYSVTTLLDPPRVVHLNKRHINDCDLFIQDLMHSWDGTAAHHYLEYCLNKVNDPHAPGKKYTLEKRYHMVVADRKVSGCYDVLLNANLSLWDLKKTSTWKHVFGDKIDWIAQQNMYRYLSWQKDAVVFKELNIMAFYRDWSKYNKMRYGAKYPYHPIMQYRLPIWSMNETHAYMMGRVELLKSYEGTPDDNLPECTVKDMWCDPDKYAIKADNRKNALRVCDSMAAAIDWQEKYLENPKCKHKIAQLSIEYRPSERTRCEHWCPVRDYCNQFHTYLKSVATFNELRLEAAPIAQAVNGGL